MVLTAGCVPSKSISIPVPEPAYWPTTDWQYSAPEAQGMDSGLLAEMIEEINTNETRLHSLIIVRNGYVVTEAYFHPYTRERKMQVQSVTKSVIGALVGIAIQKGYLKSADQRLLSFFPERSIANPSREKESIRLKHLLSMSSGFPCQEFTESGQSMEQASDWVQFMLDLPVEVPPGETFGYCDGNPHLLSAILEQTTGMTAREFANRELFAPLGIPAVGETSWWTDPQGLSTGGYGLYLRPVDLAKLALLYLQNGKWDGQQILPPTWAAESTRQYVQKPEGPGYSYLWTVYPETGRYSALGLAGQQVHIYPAQNLIVVVTAELETFVEAPEVEHMLNEFILPSIKLDGQLAENPEGVERLQSAIEWAARPVKPVPTLPALAKEVSGKVYSLEENANGWQNIVLVFEPGASTAQVSTNGFDNLEKIGLDNLYRLSTSGQSHLMRGKWVDDQTFVVEWMPMPGDNGTLEVWAKFEDERIELSVQPVLFSGEPVVIKGTK